MVLEKGKPGANAGLWWSGISKGGEITKRGYGAVYCTVELDQRN
jgi:hypothetical protein